MINRILAILFLAISLIGVSFAQQSDMIVLRRGPSKTLKTYFPGSQIHFISTGGQHTKGTIKKIERDSIFLHVIQERQNITIWGTRFWDTASIATIPFHYRDIREIYKPDKGVGIIKNGFLFMMGGAAYALLHTINAAYLKVPIEPLTLGASGAVALTGFGLNRLYRTTVSIGKRHQLQYIPMK